MYNNPNVKYINHPTSTASYFPSLYPVELQHEIYNTDFAGNMIHSYCHPSLSVLHNSSISMAHQPSFPPMFPKNSVDYNPNVSPILPTTHSTSYYEYSNRVEFQQYNPHKRPLEQQEHASNYSNVSYSENNNECGGTLQGISRRKNKKLKTMRTQYKCRLCGQPKANHKCTIQTELTRDVNIQVDTASLPTKLDKEKLITVQGNKNWKLRDLSFFALHNGRVLLPKPENPIPESSSISVEPLSRTIVHFQTPLTNQYTSFVPVIPTYSSNFDLQLQEFDLKATQYHLLPYPNHHTSQHFEYEKKNWRN